jgi:hypothetical protein
MWMNLLCLTLILGGGAIGMWRALRKPAFASLSDDKPVMDRDSRL